MPSYHSAISSADYSWLYSAISTEAARRRMGTPGVAGFGSGTIDSASLFNSFRDALIALNNFGVANYGVSSVAIPGPVYSRSTVITASQWNTLVTCINALAAQQLRNMLPNYIDVTFPAGGGYGGVSGRIVAYRNGGAFHVTAWHTWNYCGGGTAGVEIGDVGISIVPYGSTTAERFVASFWYNKGCSCGNNNNVQMIYTVTANASGGVDVSVGSTTSGQWGC